MVATHGLSTKIGYPLQTFSSAFMASVVFRFSTTERIFFFPKTWWLCTISVKNGGSLHI